MAALTETKKIYNETNSITKEQLQEFSILYLIINNFDFFKKNYHLLDEISFITKNGSKVFNTLNELVKSNEEIDQNLLPIDQSSLDEIQKFASVKHISNNIKRDDMKLEEIFNEMKKDLKNLFIEKKISLLESKFSQDMDQNTFDEIIELKNLHNNN